MNESDFPRMNCMELAHFMFDTSCAKCGEIMGKCDCVIVCRCGWGYFKGDPCRNPKCDQEQNK
jgi:hypothetical protein